jgi:hypothetical protein
MGALKSYAPHLALILGVAALVALGFYLGDSDPFCEPFRIARVIELGGCR